MSAGSPIGRLRALLVACLLAALVLPAAAAADEATGRDAPTAMPADAEAASALPREAT